MKISREGEFQKPKLLFLDESMNENSVRILGDWGGGRVKPSILHRKVWNNIMEENVYVRFAVHVD